MVSVTALHAYAPVDIHTPKCTFQNNNQQPTTNNQQPTTNNQQPTTAGRFVVPVGLSSQSVPYPCGGAGLVKLGVSLSLVQSSSGENYFMSRVRCRTSRTPCQRDRLRALVLVSVGPTARGCSSLMSKARPRSSRSRGYVGWGLAGRGLDGDGVTAAWRRRRWGGSTRW